MPGPLPENRPLLIVSRMLPGLRVRCLLVALPLLLAVLPDSRPSTLPDTPQDKTAPYPRHGRYIGMAECEVCHEVQVNALAKGHHQGSLRVRVPTK